MTSTDENVSTLEITPELAEQWLVHNTYNRRLRSGTITGYALDMANGDWVWNGESIKFADDGTLLDGQHRLAAIVESGTTVKMLVVRGLPRPSQDTIDAGITRTFSDVLKLHGEHNYVTLAATTRGVWSWERGIRRFGGGLTIGSTHTQLLATLEKYPWLREGTTTIGAVQREAALPCSVGGPLWWVFNQIEPEDAECFYKRLESGAELGENDPILVLRRAALASRDNTRGRRNATWLAAITCKAWNKFRDGEALSALQWRPGGVRPEKFPEPH